MRLENLTPKASFQAAPGAQGWSGEALTFDLKAPPTLSIKPGNPSGMTISWNAISGCTYNLQYKANLATAAWITNAITDIVATNTTVSHTDNPCTNRHRIYRVRLKEPSIGN